ncbi:MAG: response regulator [Lachnospiraceae bacterium]|nr:response regulator [Lachnospiraceae bacterium]
MTDEFPMVSFLVERDLSFVLTAVNSLLEEQQIETEKQDIHLFEKQHPDHLAPLIVAEAETLLSNDSARVILYDMCIEQGVHFILIGEAEDLRKLVDKTSHTLISATYNRPINAKDVVAKIEELVELVRQRGFRKKILVVDDSPTFLRTAAEWFEEDYNVAICPSAAAAFHMLESFKPDLILLDYEMPVCSGAQFLEMLHSEETTRHIPVIFLTSKGDSETVKSVLAMGPQGYLLKTQPKEAIQNSVLNFFNKEIMK